MNPNYHRQAIYIAFKYANINLINYFLNLKGQLHSMMLAFAAEFGHVNILRDIMKKKKYKCDPAYEDNYAILNATSFGHLDVVKFH